MVRSKSIVDQRFIDMAILMQAKHYGVKIGFKGLKDTMNEDLVSNKSLT